MSALKLKTAEEVNAILAAHSAQDERNVRRVMGERRLPWVSKQDWRAILFLLLCLAAAVGIALVMVGCSKPKPTLAALPDVHDPALHIVMKGNTTVAGQITWDGKEFHCWPAGAVCAPSEFQETEWISKLRAEAHRRGMKWRIYCTPGTDSGDKFSGWAIHGGAEWAVWIEEGAQDAWYVDSGPTQEDCAHALFAAMMHPENDIATHEPGKSPEAKKHYCPPEISGK
jgi:hypothetical protein